MENKNPVEIELYYTRVCPSCKAMQHLLDEVLPAYGERFRLKRTLASGPLGYLKTMKLGIHAVPALLINDAIVFRSLPSRQLLKETLDSFTQ